ncbi:tetraacyldisaccharide 4'-kinase [Marinomonas sp. 42_23_T18]|nr:tetraacyldisaccharide 4'-kinase [Marinomonas sp. 42_23_T18]
MSFEAYLNRAWYGKSKWTHLFLPLSPLVSYLVNQKRARFLAQKKDKPQFIPPVIVVGNITVGGTGKSPMVLALVKALKQAGYSPGIVSRGYGVSATVPILVTQKSLASECGDEPVMLVRRADCPLVICQDRVAAINTLLMDESIDLVISDDGMQHYAMMRDIEFLMLDATRGLGNGKLLPVGPLREPVTRLNQVDFIVSLMSADDGLSVATRSEKLRYLLSRYDGVNLDDALCEKLVPVPLQASELIHLKTGKAAPLTILNEYPNWQIVAGIGNPERFLNTLLEKGLKPGFKTSWFADHHDFSEQDISDDLPVVMTEKDAVKCKDLILINDNVWYLPIEVSLPKACVDSLLLQLTKIKLEKQLVGK